MKDPFRVLNYDIFRILLIFNKFKPIALEANNPFTPRNGLDMLTSKIGRGVPRDYQDPANFAQSSTSRHQARTF